MRKWGIEILFRFCSPVGSLCHTPGIVCHLTSIVCRLSPSELPETYQIHIRCKYLGFGGSPYISDKLWPEKYSFTISTSSLQQPAGGASYYSRILPKSRPS